MADEKRRVMAVSSYPYTATSMATAIYLLTCDPAVAYARIRLFQSPQSFLTYCEAAFALSTLTSETGHGGIPAIVVSVRAHASRYSFGCQATSSKEPSLRPASVAVTKPIKAPLRASATSIESGLAHVANNLSSYEKLTLVTYLVGRAIEYMQAMVSTSQTHTQPSEPPEASSF